MVWQLAIVCKLSFDGCQLCGFEVCSLTEKKLIIALLCLGNVTISFNVGAVAAAIPIISQSLGLSDLTVSRIVPFYMIPYGIGALLYAPLTRYFSYRVILTAAMAVYALMSLICGMNHSLNVILAAQVVAGIAAASSTPVSLMIIGEFFEKSVRGRLVGIYFGCAFFASVAGMVAMAVMDWPWLFIIPAILGTLTAVCQFFLRTESLDSRHQESVDYFAALKKDHIREVFIFIFCISFLYHGVHKWYGVYLNREYGLGKEAIGIILTIAALCGLAGQQIGGFLSDKKGRRTTCLLGLSGLAAGTVLLSGHFSIYALVAVMGLIGIGWTVCHNSISTILTDFPDEERPIIASLNSAVRFFSGGLGFSLTKFFVEKSFPMTFLTIGVLMFLLIFYLKDVIAEQR